MLSKYIFKWRRRYCLSAPFLFFSISVLFQPIVLQILIKWSSALAHLAKTKYISTYNQKPKSYWMYLHKVEINNIRNIDHLELDFPEPAGWHVLIGDNGAGKTTILRAISLALIGPQESMALRLALSKIVSKGKVEGNVSLQIERDMHFDRFETYSAPLKEAINAGIAIRRENKGNENGEEIKNVWRISALDSELAKHYIWSGKDGWFSSAFGPFRRFTGGSKDWDNFYHSYPRAGAHLSVFGEDVALTESLQWLRELNYKKLEKDSHAEWLLQQLVTFINKGELLPGSTMITEISSEGVQLKDGNGYKIEVTEMSDGFRSILSLTFELLRQMLMVYNSKTVFQNIEQGDYRITVPGVVLVDEIDAHLHPTWQSRIGQWFIKYFPNIQFIVTTHSPIICRAAENGSIWRLASPGSDRISSEVTGIERQRLIYGNILDAFGTELFGEDTTSSPQTTKMLEQLARLNKKSIMGTISEEEKAEREKLLAILPTEQSA